MKRKIISILTGIVLVVGIASAALAETQSFTEVVVHGATISAGMSMDQVMKIMGQPIFKTVSPAGMEIWYCQSGINIHTVIFQKGKVVGTVLDSR